MGKVTKLKQRGDRQGLFVVLDNKNDWMLSLDAAEALVQLDDDRGLNYLIGALDDPKAAVRDVSREILEGLNNPEGNLALQSHPPGSIHSDPEEEHTDWLARLKYFKGIIVSRQKKTVWNFSLEWMIASALGMSLRHMFFGILLYPLDFLESSESVFITKPVLAFVNSMWGEVSKNSVRDIFFTLSIFRGDLLSLVLEGGLIGTAQWFILKRYGIHLKAWALAVVCGWTLGFIISQEASWPIASALIDSRGPYWEQSIILGYTLFGLFFGALMGISQEIVLRKYYGQNIISWIIFNMLVWTCAYFVSEVLIDKLFWAIVGFPLGVDDSKFILHNTIMQFSELTIAGIFTGIMLFRISQNYQKDYRPN